MLNNIKRLFLVLTTVSLFSCQSNKHESVYINPSELQEVNVSINRYGKALFELDTLRFRESLMTIQKEFPYFLDADLNDSANIEQLYSFVTDSQTKKLYQKTIEVYPDLEQLELELSEAYSRYSYFFPDNGTPDVYTYVSDLYYERPVWLKDSVLVVALDIYLGSDFFLYPHLQLPQYKINCLAPEYISVDVMKAIYFEDVWPNPKQKTLLDRMIGGGKLLYYLDAVMPNIPDTIKLCYTQAKLNWAEENEKNIWAFLVQNELLYATDFKTQSNLIQDGPFTTGFSNESPSRLGVFIGWKIVKDYMTAHPETSLQELIQINDSQLILQQSGYKP